MAPLEALGTAEVISQGCAYTVSLDIQAAGRAEVVVRQRTPAVTWSSTFTASYIEALTAKASSPRSYEAFITMLMAALRRTSSSVSLDILSSSDLAAMTDGAEDRDIRPVAAPTSASANKRYMILTHVSDFERVHYPLPLSFQSAHKTASAEQTLPTAAAAGPALHDLLAEISHLRKDCSALRRQLRSSKHEYRDTNSADLSAALQQAHGERDAAVSTAQAARGQVQRLLTALRRQQQEAQHQAACSAADLQRARAEAMRWRARCQQLPVESQPPPPARRSERMVFSRPHSASALERRLPGCSSSASTRRLPRKQTAAQPAIKRASVELATSQRAAARPWSAPAARQRFDPTGYVREQQQREVLLAARLGRRPVTPGLSSRRSSAQSVRPQTPISAGLKQPYRRSSSPSIAVENLKAQLQCMTQRTHVSADSNDELPLQRLASRQQRPRTDCARPDTYKQQGQQCFSPDNDAARDMASIDSRLLALQKFLMSAKSAP